jgi:hypothetical protein
VAEQAEPERKTLKPDSPYLFNPSEVSVPALKAELAARSLSTDGSKDVLVARLLVAVIVPGGSMSQLASGPYTNINTCTRSLSLTHSLTHSLTLLQLYHVH